MLNFSDEFFKGNLRAVIFNMNSKNELIDQINKNSDNLFDIAGSINCHEQFGASVVIEDMRLSE